MRSLLSSMPSHPATHYTPAAMHQSCLQHTAHGWPPPSHLSCTWEGRGRREGEGGRRGEGGREGGGEGEEGRWRERDQRREGRKGEGGEVWMEREQGSKRV